MLAKVATFWKREASFFFLLPILALLLVPLVLWSESQILSQVSRSEPPTVAPFFRSAILLIALGSLLFFTCFSPLSKLLHSDREGRFDLLASFAFAVGFANLLFGFITSFIGYLLFFVVGLVLLAIKDIMQKKRPKIEPRGLLLAIASFILYAAISIFLSPDRAEAFETFRLLIWLLVIPLLFAFYPPSQRVLQDFSRWALAVGYIYIISVLFLYVLSSIHYCSPLDAAFHLGKNYFRIDHQAPHNPHFILLCFGARHYTFLIFVLVAPLLFRIQRGGSLVSTLCYTLGLLLYTHVIQSRLWILVLPLLLAFAFVHQLGGKRAKLIFYSVVMLGMTALFFTLMDSPILQDSTRIGLWELAFLKVKENILLGNGLASVVPYLESQGSSLPHFHNSFIQVYFEMGLIGLLFVLSILALYAFHCKKNRNLGGILLLFACIGLMTTDEIVNSTDLFFDVLLLMSLYIHSKEGMPKLSTPQGEQALPQKSCE